MSTQLTCLSSPGGNWVRKSPSQAMERQTTSQGHTGATRLHHPRRWHCGYTQTILSLTLTHNTYCSRRSSTVITRLTIDSETSGGGRSGGGVRGGARVVSGVLSCGELYHQNRSERVHLRSTNTQAGVQRASILSPRIAYRLITFLNQTRSANLHSSSSTGRKGEGCQARRHCGDTEHTAGTNYVVVVLPRTAVMTSVDSYIISNCYSRRRSTSQDVIIGSHSRPC